MRLYLAGNYPNTIGGGWKNKPLAVLTIIPNKEKEMNIYLAGGVTGNLQPYWTKVMRGEIIPNSGMLDVNILESYAYLRGAGDDYPKLFTRFKSFLLDSGAFTFMQGNGGSINWDSYTEQYAEYINRWKIDFFFELDIDSIVGLREVERLRAKLERLTGKQPIPVWHINRGKDYFLNQMCGEYKYVALGGIVGAKKGSQVYLQYQAAFPWFIREAHKRDVKIHGLGFTSLEGIKKYHFDSVDSTAWLYGNRGGYLYQFDFKTGTMGKIPSPPGHRLKSREAAMYNFNEWIKFSKYAEKYL